MGSLFDAAASAIGCLAKSSMLLCSTTTAWTPAEAKAWYAASISAAATSSLPARNGADREGWVGYDNFTITNAVTGASIAGSNNNTNSGWASK
jgi:hypothetical protein